MPKVRSQKTTRVHKEVVKQGMKFILYLFIIFFYSTTN